ncbi:hypothetical protein N7931_00755 [Catenovulum sp. 2E275]|uniref:hypothetical protein n=1 Tax=Catenovulum sp. 2E275 TaxID=2980497 RepID=UPI0021CFD988|nr:hypothetical protein [Catenovulum sp. 2E275]MCU4674151.1 hypothetical protein [Catenovulum sp. 2E275]
MFKPVHLMITCAAISVLSACGSGGSESDSQSIIDNPQSHSESQLIAAYKDKVNSLYSGNKQSAELNLSTANDAFHAVWGVDQTPIPYIPFEDIMYMQQQTVQAKSARPINTDGNFSKHQVTSLQSLVAASESGTFNCAESGTISIVADLDEDNVGLIQYKLNNCRHNYLSILSGKGTISATKGINDRLNFVLFFDNVTSQTLDYYTDETVKTYSTSGYLKITTTQNYPEIKYEEYLINSFNGRDVVTQLSDSFTNPSGDVYISDIGHFKVDSDLEGNSPFYPSEGSMSFSGEQDIQFEFSYNNTKYIVDTDNDGEYDSGAYLSPFYNIDKKQDTTGIALVTLDKLSLPPVISEPRLNYWDDYYTTTPITVQPGYISDVDTEQEELEISFNWYINDVLVEGLTTDTLPAYTAIFGDEVKVSMLVSDGINNVESDFISLTISDSPSTFTVSNLPDNVKAGDVVQFNVNVSDPDYPNADNSAINFEMSGAPDGAVMDETGLIKWTVNSDLIFPEQTFNFSFAMLGETSETSPTNTLPIAVNTGGKMPIARSGMEVPYQNDSIWIGDFTGDGNNEILSTDSRNRVFLISENNDNYQQFWMYPFQLPTTGQIVQVIGKNIDQDAELEIIVATEQGLTLIDNQTAMASVLLETQNDISKFNIIDLNNNGELALVLLTSSNSSNKSLRIYALNDLSTEVFSTNVSSATDMTFGNVDNDSQLEIILNNGRVYDGQSFANQWLSGTAFGSQAVKAADLDNDGLDEIIGVDSWGRAAVFSAQAKAQLYSFDNFNTCSLETKNIDQDPAAEVLIGDCQWGNITAYDWNTTEQILEQKWAIDMQGHGSKSIAVGDSDNDGSLEVHWGSDQSSSGADSFVIADIEQETVSLKLGADSPQLDSYSSAGWVEVEPEQEKAVFFVPSSGSGYDSSRLVLMDANGNIEISDEISSNWDNSQHAAVTDYDNDGYGELFGPATQTYDGVFSVVEISNMTEQWSIEGDYDSNIGVVSAYKINNDDYVDAVYADSSILNLLDVENQLIIANHAFDSRISDFDIAKLNDQATFAVSTYDRLHLLQYNQNKLTELSYLDKACSRVVFFNQDDDLTPEILCVASSSYYNKGQITIYKFVNSELIEAGNYQLNQIVRDVVVDTSSRTQQNFFAILSDEEYSGYYDTPASYLAKFNAGVQQIWASPALIGTTNIRGLKHRYSTEKGHQFMLSTRQAMYLINP